MDSVFHMLCPRCGPTALKCGKPSPLLFYSLNKQKYACTSVITLFHFYVCAFMFYTGRIFCGGALKKRISREEMR